MKTVIKASRNRVVNESLNQKKNVRVMMMMMINAIQYKHYNETVSNKHGDLQ